MKTHHFTLILAGVGELTSSRAQAEATDGDLELNQRGGVLFAEMQKPARTLQEAITASIRDVEKAGVGVKVVRVESETANVIAKINAELLGTTGD